MWIPPFPLPPFYMCPNYGRCSAFFAVVHYLEKIARFVSRVWLGINPCFSLVQKVVCNFKGPQVTCIIFDHRYQIYVLVVFGVCGWCFLLLLLFPNLWCRLECFSFISLVVVDFPHLLGFSIKPIPHPSRRLELPLLLLPEQKK